MPDAPALPENAPFNAEQRAWLNGMIAALYPHRSAATRAPEAPEPRSPSLPVTLLFASQTGTTEALAKKTAKAAQKHNLTCTINDLASYEPENLTKETHLLILTSTYGDGEPPDSAKAFYDHIHSANAPSLEHITYSVLGLGDSGYPDFNQCAKDIDARMSDLGATRITAAIYCDLDYDTQAAAWQTACFISLTSTI